MSDMYVMTEVAVAKSEAISSAPNGSTRNNRDCYTFVTYMQDWTAGAYAGCTYRIVETYISSSPERRGQLVSTTSTFLFGPDN